MGCHFTPIATKAAMYLRQVGVLAQDVAQEVKPDAVARMPSGYLAVDHGKALSMAESGNLLWMQTLSWRRRRKRLEELPRFHAAGHGRLAHQSPWRGVSPARTGAGRGPRKGWGDYGHRREAQEMAAKVITPYQPGRTTPNGFRRLAHRMVVTPIQPSPRATGASRLGIAHQ